jgi:hypothetical protein
MQLLRLSLRIIAAGIGDAGLLLSVTGISDPDYNKRGAEGKTLVDTSTWID